MTHQQIAAYRAALREARAEFDCATKRLHEATTESRLLNEQIERLRRTITALAAMCSEEPALDSMGITDSILEVMQRERGAVTTGDVVKALEERGFDLASQKNAYASVHAILARLARRDYIRRDKDVKGATVWKGPNYDPIITDEDIPF